MESTGKENSRAVVRNVGKANSDNDAELNELRAEVKRLSHEKAELLAENIALKATISGKITESVQVLIRICRDNQGIDFENIETAAGKVIREASTSDKNLSFAEIAQAADRLSEELVKPGRTVVGLLNFQQSKAWRYQRGIDAQIEVLKSIRALMPTEEVTAEEEIPA